MNGLFLLALVEILKHCIFVLHMLKTLLLQCPSCRPMYISSTYGDERSSDLVVAELLLEHIEPLLLVRLHVYSVRTHFE